MKEYNRYADNLEFCSPCYLCKHQEEMPKRNTNKCSASECDYLRCYELLADLEDTIENAAKVEVHYKPPHKTKYAVIEYSTWKNKPRKVASYYIYGEELKTGKPLVCWHWQASMMFNVIEDDFDTEEEATTRLKELKQANQFCRL